MRLEFSENPTNRRGPTKFTVLVWPLVCADSSAESATTRCSRAAERVAGVRSGLRGWRRDPRLPRPGSAARPEPGWTWARGSAPASGASAPRTSAPGAAAARWLDLRRRSTSAAPAAMTSRMTTAAQIGKPCVPPEPSGPLRANARDGGRRDRAGRPTAECAGRPRSRAPGNRGPGSPVRLTSSVVVPDSAV